MYSVVWAKNIAAGHSMISEFQVCFVSAYFLRIEAIWLLFTGNIPRGIAGNGADSDMRRYLFGKNQITP